jgi:hypothetical protein
VAPHPDEPHLAKKTKACHSCHIIDMYHAADAVIEMQKQGTSGRQLARNTDTMHKQTNQSTSVREQGADDDASLVSHPAGHQQ